MAQGTGTRARIERAALELFVDRGVRETTIRDIANRAGVAEGALYRHHSGKDELVWHLFSVHYAELGRGLASILAERDGFDARMDAMVQSFCRLHDEDPVLFGFLLLVQHGQLGRVPDGMPSPVEAVCTAVADAMAVGEIPAGDPEVVGAMVMGIVLQAATFKLYGRIDAPMGRLALRLAAACKAAARAG